MSKVVSNAIYRALVGPKTVNDVLRCADLGIGGAFIEATYRLSWDVAVTQERAEAMVPVLKQGINEMEALECVKVTLVSLIVDPEQ